METLSSARFTQLLRQADAAQAAFARLAGITPRQVNNWCRNRAHVPRWAAMLAVILQQHSLDSLEIELDEYRRAEGPGPDRRKEGAPDAR